MYLLESSHGSWKYHFFLITFFYLLKTSQRPRIPEKANLIARIFLSTFIRL